MCRNIVDVFQEVLSHNTWVVKDTQRENLVTKLQTVSGKVYYPRKVL